MEKQTCPMSTKEVMDAYFLDNRARLVEIASFLDRIDRAQGLEKGKTDFRYKAFLRALRSLAKGGDNRVATVLLSFSDLSAEPRESAKGLKGAYGAWEGPFGENH